MLTAMYQKRDPATYERKGRKSDRPLVRTPHNEKEYRFFEYTYFDQSENIEKHGYIQAYDENGKRRNIAGSRFEGKPYFFPSPNSVNLDLLD